MSAFNLFKRVSQAPTNPKPAGKSRQFDVADLYKGPLDAGDTTTAEVPLDEKLRQAYFWIVNHAVISPHYDIEYNDGPAQTYRVGDSKRLLTLPSAKNQPLPVLQLPLVTLSMPATRCNIKA